MYTIKFDLNNLLEEKRVSKTEFCKQCHLERTQLNNYCKNITQGISFDVLGRMCECLNCTPNDILKLEEE